MAISRQDLIDLLVEARPTLSDEKALLFTAMYPKWSESLAVSVGDRYQYNGNLYKVVQAHTTQADWTPDITPALWVKVSLEEWPEWVQPTGSHDAYSKGDKVIHNSIKYISLIDANVWEPGTTGTETLWEVA